VSGFRQFLSFSNVVAVVALFFALGGTVYAAGKISGSQIKPKSIPGNRLQPKSVSAAQIKAKTLTAAQVKAGSLTGVQIKAGSITGTQIAEARSKASAPRAWRRSSMWRAPLRSRKASRPAPLRWRPALPDKRSSAVARP